MADGYLNFDTKINEQGFNQGLSKLTGLAKSGVKNVGKALAGVTAVLGAGTVAGVKYNATIESYQTSFEVMTGSAEKAAAIVDKLTRIGAETPFEMTGLADVTQLLMNYGLSADDAMAKMMMLGDISQGSADKMNRIAMAYGQMSSAGKVQLEDVKQMIEAGFNPLQEISQSTGESMESLYDRISKGTLSVDEITASMERSTSVGGKYYQSMEKQSKTVSGQLSTLSDNAQQLLGSLTSGVSKMLGEKVLPAVNEMLGGLNDAFQSGGFQGFLDELGNAIPAIQGVTDAIGSLALKLQGMSADELKELGKIGITVAGAIPTLLLFGKGIGVVKTATEGFNGITSGVIASIGKMPGAFQNVAKGLSGLRKDFASLSTNFSGSITSILGKAAGFAPQFLKFMNIAGGIGIVVAGLGLLYSQFGSEIDQILVMVQTKGPEIIRNLCNGITAALPNLIAQGATLINHLLQAITANIPAIVSGGIQILAGLVTGLASQLPMLIPTALQMILTLVQSLLANIPQLIQAGLQLITGLVQGIINAVPMLISAIPGIVQALVTGIASNLPTIIMTGIQLLIALITGIIQAIPQLLSAIPLVFDAFVQGITSIDWLSVGQQILQMIVDGIVSIGSALWDAITNIFDGGEEKAAEKGKSTGEKYAQGVQSTTTSAQTSGTNVANAATGAFTSTLNMQGPNVSLAAMNMGNNASLGLQTANVPLAFTTNAQTAATGLTTTLTANNGMVNMAAMGLGTSANTGITGANMGQAFSTEGTQAGHGLTAGLNAQAGSVSGAAGNVANAAQSAAAGVNLGGSYSKEGAEAAKNLASSLKAGTSSVTNAGKNLGSAALKGLTSVKLSTKAKTEATKFANGFADGMKGKNSTVINAGKSIGAAAVTGLISANLSTKGKTEGSKFTNAISSGISSGAGSVAAAGRSIVNSVISAVGGLSASGRSAGVQFSSGLANGIRAGQGGVAAAAAQVANAAVQAAKRNLDINSPSKVGDWIGKMFDLGIARGIVRNISGVRAGVDKMSDIMEIGTMKAMQSMQRRAVQDTTIVGLQGRRISGGVHGSYNTSTNNYVTQNVNINQPVKSPVETARALRRTGKELAFGR